MLASVKGNSGIDPINPPTHTHTHTSFDGVKMFLYLSRKSSLDCGKWIESQRRKSGEKQTNGGVALQSNNI